MATYMMSPKERRARAREIVARRNALSQQKRAQELAKAYEKQERDRLAAEKAEKEKKENANWLVRGLSTIGDIAANVITGAVKGLEGIYDLGAGIVGAVGGIFSDDFQDSVQKHIAYDWTSENIGDPMQEWFKYSYTKDGGILEGIASGVGQMLPAVAVTLATGGAGAASIGTLGASATGNATESAYKDGASYYGGLGYGVASGAVEMATEKLFGGATKNIFGKGMLDDVGESIADTGLKRVAKNALGEGFEEVVAEVANPAVKAIYKGKDAFSEYGESEYWKGVGKAGAIGSLTALAYSVTVGYGLAKRGKGYVGSEADINDSLHEIEGQKKKANNLFANDRLSDENAARITQNLQGNYQNIEKTLKKATPEKRANLIKKFSLESAFEADGTMKADFASTLDFTKQAEAITENGVNGSENAVASLDRRYINPDLIGQDSKVNETLSVATEGLRQAYMKEHNTTHEQAVEAVKDITAFKGELSDKGKASYSKFKKGLNYLNGVSGHTVNMVVVEEHDSFNGNISDDTIYIGADTFENDSWAGTLVHEYTHFAEGSKEYQKLVRYLKESKPIATKAVQDVFGKGYGFTFDGIENIYNKLDNGEKLTDSERQTLTAYESELGAHLSENLLGNEEFIDKLVAKETTIAEKVLNKIDDLKKMFERIGNAEARAEYKQIKKAEKLYLGAVEKAGYTYVGRKIIASRKEELDESEEIQYNRKYFKFLHKNFPDESVGVRGVTTAHRIALDWARKAKTGDQTLISYKNHWYKVERFDDALNNYQVEEFITVAEYNKISKEIKDYGRSGKIESIQGRVNWIDSCNRQSYSLKRREQGLDGLESRYGREDNQVQRLDKDQAERGKQSSSNGGRNSSSGGANQQRTNVKYSLKESVEKDVLAHYGTTYRWAETGYIFKDGTRLDLSGRRDGASGGRRTVDHRDIFDVYEDIDGGEAMIEFMSRGNIRVSPENPGINLQVEPTAEQYRLIQDMVERLGWKEEYFSVDFDDSNGDTVESLTYEGKVSARKVVADIKYYFKEGKLPYQSELSQFRFSLKDSNGNSLTEEQAKFFADSKIRDEQGNLRVMYHGTAKNFNTFLRSKMGKNGLNLGEGFYFTPNKDQAEGYAEGKSPRIMEVYLNVKNPLSRENSLSKNEEAMEWLYEKVGEDHSKEYIEAMTEGLVGSIELIKEYTEKTGEGVDEILKRFGYDGIDAVNTFVVFDSNQVKYTTNQKPSQRSDMRYSLKDKYFYRLTDGQVKKALANYTKFKVYSKVDAESIINNVLGNYMSFGESYGVISGKTKNEVIEMLWRGLNTAEPGRQAKVALDIAEYILQNAVLENIYEDDSNQVYIDTIQVLKPYLHSINLNGIKGDIKHKYDRDNSPYRLWGKRKEHGGKGADVIAMELEEQGFYIDGINEADIFFQIDTAYREAVAALKKQAKELLDSSLSKEERYELKQQIAKEVLRGFDYQGKPSKLADIAKTYSDKAKFWKDKYYDERKRNTVINRLLDSVQKIKDIKLGTFLNATQFKSDMFKGSIEKLSNIKYRGDLNKSGTRKIVAGLHEWYSKENPMLENDFDEEIFSMLNEIATGEGDLTTSELRALANVVDYFKHFIENYNKVYRNGKYVDAQPIVEKYIGIIQNNNTVKVGWIPRLFDKIFNNAKGSYLQTFADPMTVARYMDKYDEGFYSDMLTSLRSGAMNAQIDEMEMRAPIEEFFKKHKKYMQGLEQRKVKYMGQDIPAREALTLYMTLGREQALAGLAESGFEYTDGKESIRVNGFAVGEELSLFELIEYGKLLQETLAKQFTEADMEYIEIARRLFNEVCRDKKKETDLLRKGYSNIAEGEYIPIDRANISRNVDTTSLEFELNRASNASFNKDIVKGAKNELFIEALDRVLDRHIRAVAQYANLSLSIDEYNKLYSLDVGGNANKSVSVQSEGKNAWAKGDEYFRKLISDIQGIPATKGDGLRAISYIRGSYAKYQLGANPKVWLTQLSSFGAAGSMLDVGSIVKGMSIKSSDVDEYCALAKLRNNDNTAAMAQGVLDRNSKTGKMVDRVNKAGDLLMKPIGTVDRFVITKLFGACQIQVEKNSGVKVGTKENKIKAGELLEKVILETQQNSMATERSSAMRSGSELMRTITMFSADSMKVIGRVVDSVGELSVLKAKRKVALDADEISKLDKKISTAKKKVAKSTASLATTAVFMAMIAQLFRWLYNKEDEEEKIVQNMTVDAVGNLLGGLPLIRDVYSRFADGYDISDYAYSALNDLLDSGYNIFAMVGDVFSGETDSQTVAKNIKNLFYASGQILGLPTRNVYNMAYGITKRLSPGTAYKVDSWFYNQNYSSDLAKAIESEDEEMIATIVGIMLDEKVGDIENSSVRKELNDLVEKGFNVLPKSVGNSLTYDGENIALTNGQAKSFKAVYSVANEALASLVELSQYSSATDEVKAKAINFIWEIYYNLAIEEVLGVDIVSKAVLFAEAIDIEKLAIIIATARTIEADTDKNGNSISGTRKAKIQKYVASLKLTAVQKYMVMGYLGYSNKNGESQVKSYINRLNLSKTEKEELLAYSGY